MANTCYDNFFLSNEIEDQYQSHLDLQQFCTVDNNLTGVAGMVRKIHKYKATDGTEKLAMGVGNTKTIEAGYTEKEYRIQMAQNRFQYGYVQHRERRHFHRFQRGHHDHRDHRPWL